MVLSVLWIACAGGNDDADSRDYELLHDARQTWTHERGVRWQHAGILILSQVRGMRPEQHADPIDALVRDAATDLDTALYNRDSQTGWLRGPLSRRAKGSGNT